MQVSKDNKRVLRNNRGREGVTEVFSLISSCLILVSLKDRDVCSKERVEETDLLGQVVYEIFVEKII